MGDRKVRVFSSTLLAAALVTLPGALYAQSLDQGLELFDGEEYAEAAVTFYSAASTDPDPNKRNEALVYLAETLKRMGFWGPASFYFSVILEDGPSNRRYLNAVAQLLEIQEQYHDHIFIADLIDKNFDGAAFAKLTPRSRIDHINYLLGAFSLRKGKERDAEQFLEFVRKESPYFGEARYLLGLTAIRQGEAAEAVEHFEAVVASIEPESGDDEQRRLRQLALLAKARASYTTGNYEDSIELYGEIPRYSEFWFQALYEQAWAHYQEQRFGESLGALESTLSPYFAKRHVPEAFVIQGTSYFTYCQWDRVRRVVEQYKELYGPMKTDLEAYLSVTAEETEFLEDVILDGNGKYSAELAREARRPAWFKDLFFQREHLKWQLAQVDEIGVWNDSRFANDIKEMISDKLAQVEAFAGAFVRQRLQFMAGNLKNFQSQIDILDFELVDAERQWLEQGREILKGRRAQLPRPEIPTDQWQHWSTGSESWKDELGYFQHTLRSECN